ncbi:MAG: LuxR C-terminal-related transcriptional regulator [Nitrospira sp.]|nr:hypothetical protein [Nitrospira sp.]
MKNVVELPNGCRLTERELEILRWVAFGKTNEAIAMIHNCSMNTVKNQLRLIFQKLDVVNRAQAVMEAIRLGMMKHHDPSR